MNRTDIVTLLQNVRATLSKKSSRLSFDHPNCLSDEDYYSLTGVTKHQFSQISSRLSSLRNSSVRSVESCLGILLVKLRTGLPNSILSTLFSLTKSQIQRSIHSAKNAMMSDYVPHHLGFSHIDHETFVREHNTRCQKPCLPAMKNQPFWYLMELISTYKKVPTINSRELVTVCINIDPSLK